MENKKIILITGASRGIGRALALGLSKNNIVIANYNKSEKEAESLISENIEIYKADVSKADEIENMVNYVLNKYGRIDVLINNAGIDLVKMYTDVTDEDFHKMINVNLYSVFKVSQKVLKNMVQNKNGVIINISSIWGRVGASCESIYSMTKAGVDGLTKSLAKEYGPSNIRVNSIAPGFIDTDMNKDVLDEDIRTIEEEIPLGRIGKPEELVNVIEMLIENKYITGQIIEVNGGWHI